MKCTIPEISWHNRDPVLSVDIQPPLKKSTVTSGEEDYWRLATGGADCHVLIWYLKVNEIGAASVHCVADLERHQKAVNVVRFSPSGEFLATGDDESVIIIWKQKEDGSEQPPPLEGKDFLDKEQWAHYKVLRGHLEDVYDISWSPDSNFLISGSVDNCAIIWNVHKGRNIGILQDHKGFVQGVSWDPLNQSVVTLSTDRYCRLYDLKSHKIIQKVHKAKIPTPPGHALEGQVVRLFHDDTFKSFFRRLTYSIDGSLIIAPSGIIELVESSQRFCNATFIFSRHNLKEPIAVLPSLDESTIAVRCCPVYFKLRDDGPVGLFSLPHRLIFAVATQKSVLIYDTQQQSPIAVISHIHYTRLTDVTWSSDGRILVVSSTDGYCSIIHFEEGELGTVYEGAKTIPISSKAPKKVTLDAEAVPKIPARVGEEEIRAEFDTDAMDIDITRNLERSARKLEQVSAKENHDANDIMLTEETEDIKLVFEDTTTSHGNDGTKSVEEKPVVRTTPPKTDCLPALSSKTPRRVKLITLSSPKRPKQNK